MRLMEMQRMRFVLSMDIRSLSMAFVQKGPFKVAEEFIADIGNFAKKIFHLF